MSLGSQQGIRVLHVDDDPSITDLTGTFLEREDDRFTVETATSADEGLRRISDRPPDCVVSDYNMPGMDGLEFLRTVRETHPDLPFILYTGKGSEAVASEAIAADVTDYLQKQGGSEQYELLANRIRNAVRARRETRRVRRQEQLMRLTEFAGDTGGFEIDVDSGELLLTDGTRRLVGLPDDAHLTLEEAIDLYHPDDRADVRRTVTRAAEAGERTGGTWRLRTLDGDERFVSVTIVPAAEDGDVTTLRGAVHDVTERRERRQDLEQIETLFQHTQDSLFLIDVAEEFTVERVNPAYEKTTGLSADRLQGRTPREILGEQQGATVERRYRDCVERREPLEYTERLRFDGEPMQWETRIAPVVLEGSVEYIVGATRDVTDREERRRELGRLQRAIDGANVSITLADPSQPDEPLVYVNDAFEEATGYPPEETLGRNCRFLQGEDTDPEKVAALREAIDNEESISVELRNYRKDGTEFWNRLTVTPIYDDDDELVRYLGTQEDVTERKERERELRAERRFIEQVLDTLDDLFYVLDTDGTFRRWNDRLPEVTGYEDPELADMRATELFPEDERGTVTDAIETTLMEGRVTTEADLLAADGERRPYEFTGSRLTDADGTTTGLTGIGRDLTERKRRERRFRALVEECGDVISVVDTDGVVQYRSPSIERILGYDPEETIGDTAWEYVHPDDRADVVEAFERGVADPDANPVVEYRARHADGSWRWLEATGNNQLDNPAVEGYVINSRDVTERKERERELERTRDLLSEMEELAGIGAWEYDPDAGIPTNTAGARRIYGVDLESSLSLDEAFAFFHPEDRERLRARFEACLETGEPYEMDARITTTEGARRWVTARGKRIDEPGSDGVVRGYIQDITDEKTRERRLTGLNRTLQDLLAAETRREVADIGVRAARDVLDLQANAVHLREGDDTLKPVAQTDELVSLLDEVPPLSVTDSTAGRVYQDGEPTVIEDARQEPDAHEPETGLGGRVYLPLAEHGVLIAGSEAQAAFDRQNLALGELLAGSLVAAFDRIDRQQAARKRREQLSLFFEESPLGAVRWDEEFRFERLNERAEGILGYSEAELRGEPWRTIVAEEDRDYVGDVVAQLLDADGGTHAINRNVRRDGETRVCKWHNRAVTDADGDVRAIFSKFEDITEQEKRKRELREVKGQYQTLVDNFPNGAVFLYDTDLRVVRAGGSELSDVGLSPDDVEGTTPHDRYPSDIAEELVHHIENAFTGESHTFEQEYDDEHYRVQMVPVRTDEGEIVHVMAVSENITERKERELELERYERLVENLPVGVFRTTVGGEIIDVNEAATEIYDAESRAQLRTVDITELYSDDSDRDDLLDRIRETGRIEDELLEFETLDGTRRFVRTTLALTEDGESEYLEGILRDVTDRRELEREFAQIKTIAESLNDAVYVVDEDGRFTYINDEFVELTGYAEKTILGSTPALIKDEETVETAKRQLGRLLSEEGPDTVTFETAIQPSDGDPIVCEDHMGVLPYEGDSFNGSVGVLRDISERKRRERELRRERDRLDEFAGVVSHDLRNPLQVASGRLELIRRECASDHIDDVSQALDRMDTLIEDLLTLAREGDQLGEIEPIVLADLGRDCWQNVAAPEAEIAIDCDRIVRADRTRLRQLLENLLRNAVEHGGEGVTVTIGDVATGFYLEDDGPGIPEEKRPDAFEAGYSTSPEGTGFGLRIVKQVADAHGWEITVSDGERGGARFEITGVEFAEN